MIESLVLAVAVVLGIVLLFWVISALVGIALFAGLLLFSLPGWLLLALFFWLFFVRKRKNRR